MPLQNRVTPFSELIADPARGLFMGNRGGRLHDPLAKMLTGRQWMNRRWIICRLSFKGRHREVWGPGYTHLFFLDEVTALAAGHRPCAECRRLAANAFRAAFTAGTGLPVGLRLDDLDRRLHGERVEGRGQAAAQPRWRCDIDSLPDGAMIAKAGEALAVRGRKLLRWDPSGYAAARPRPMAETVIVLTPPSTVAALAAGYRPEWHPTA